jgi:hypothetical protein
VKSPENIKLHNETPCLERHFFKPVGIQNRKKASEPKTTFPSTGAQRHLIKTPKSRQLLLKEDHYVDFDNFELNAYPNFIS